MDSSSASVSAGITGAAITPVGMPAAASSRMVAIRRVGVAARGSSRRARVRSSVVTETHTCASPFAAMGARMSMSRSTSADLVTMPTGWPKAASTSRMERVMPNSRSAGW